MGKKVIILNGSPRRNGNTAGLVKAFTEGAQSMGHEVTEFFLDGMDINGCKGCLGGKGKEEHPCTQRDDMDKIYPVMKEAEVVIFASPLYYWTLSGQLRTAIDRLFAIEEGGGGYLGGHGRSCALLMAAEGDGFANVAGYFDFLMEKLHWNNLGHVLASGCTLVGDIEGKEILKQARELGRNI